MLSKKLIRLWRRRKAISPIVTSIIVIITTLTISSIIYFFVIPYLTREDLVIINYTLEDTNDSNFADTITIEIRNIGSINYNISDVLVDRYDSSLEWSLGESVYMIAHSEITIINCSASASQYELAFGQTAKFKLVYGNKILIFSFRIPAEFGTFDIIVGENFENFTYLNWKHESLFTHDTYGNNNILDWKIANTTGNDYWHCTSNDCQYVIKNQTNWLFNTGNFSCDMNTNGDDAMGIIFKYDNTGLYPKFYLAWYTLDHPSARNGPHVGEENIFDWHLPSDQINPGEITIHYVEGDAEGFNWYKLASVKWERETNEWYTWRINAKGSTYELFVNENDTPELTFINSSIFTGYIGLISFANENSLYDNLFIW